MPAIRTKIRKFLQEKGIKQREISATGLISDTNLSLFVNGYSSITTSTLKKLCIFLNCTPNDILDWERWVPALAPKPEGQKPVKLVKIKTKK